MKISEKTKEKKEKIKKKEKVKPKKEQVLIVAQEIKFARLLSGNEKKTRDRVLNSLKKWLLDCFEKGYEFKEDDFIRVWKGLFYAVWMSDKPLVQEELCEKIAGILDLFPEEQLRHALLMFKAGLRVLATEWYGLDQHRTDKFLMLVRRFLRASLRCLKRSDWDLSSCEQYAQTLAEGDGILALKTPHYARNSMSMLLHFVDCFLEEVAKVSNGDIPENSFVELLRPLCTYMCRGEAPLLCTAARRLLTALVRQSEQGLQYQQATAAWQKMGCPEGGPEALELVSDSEDDEDGQQNGDVHTDDEDESAEKPLDPRAGRVDVELPCLPVPAMKIADMLRGLLATASSGRHRRVKLSLQCFEQLSRSQYPLRVAPMAVDSSAPAVNHKKSAQTLHALEKKLVAASDELALRGLSRKHRKRLLAKSRSGTTIVEEVETLRQKLSTNVTNGGWHVETTEPEPKKLKQSSANNANKKRKNNTNGPNNKERRIEDKVNGDATLKQHKVDKKQKVAEDNHTVDHKLGKSKKIEQKVKDKLSQSCQINGSRKGKDKTAGILENGVKNESNINVKISNRTQHSEKVEKKPNDEGKNIANKTNKNEKKNSKTDKNPTFLVNKVRQFNKKSEFQKQSIKLDKKSEKNFGSPKKVKFALSNNSMQQPVDYYKSVRQSPSIPFDAAKKPTKTNLKPGTPSPINPFFKKLLRLKH